MRLLICDNSALSALAEIGHLELLPDLFGNVTITESVFGEAAHPNAPSSLRETMASPPPWLLIVQDPLTLLPETKELDIGEASSITFAVSQGGEAIPSLVIDDRDARKVSQALGLETMGVVAILGLSAKRGLVRYDQVIRRLRETVFFVTDRIIEAVSRKFKL